MRCETCIYHKPVYAPYVKGGIPLVPTCTNEKRLAEKFKGDCTHWVSKNETDNN